MKLKKIKMSGFKSFVDPTTIQLQSSFWKYAWKDKSIVNNRVIDDLVIKPKESKNILVTDNNVTASLVGAGVRHYKRSNKPREKMGPRTWHSRKDPFQDAWSGLRMQLELNPERTAKSLLDDLIDQTPGQFNHNLLRTLQRRVADWRLQQIKIKQEKLVLNIQNNAPGAYISLVGHAVANG